MGLREDILTDTVAELVLRKVIKVQKHDTISHAVSLMQEHRLGCVVVVDDEDRPLGKFTEKILLSLLLKNAKALDQHVGDHMVAAYGVVEKTDPISKVLDAMQSKELRFVIVTDDDGRAIGLTGQKGMMEYITEHFPRQIKSQMMESKLFMDQREGA